MYLFPPISFCDIVMNVALDRLTSTPHLDLAPPPVVDPPCRVDPRRQLEGLLPAPAFAENSVVVWSISTAFLWHAREVISFP